MDFGAITGTFANIPMDWIILGVVALLAAFDVVRAGSRRVTTFALALPVALLAFSALGQAAVLGPITAGLSLSYAQALFFIALVFIMYILIGRIGISYGSGPGQPIQAALAGVALAAITTVVWIQVSPLDSIWHFGSQVQSLFGESYRFWWLIGSYMALAFARSR